MNELLRNLSSEEIRKNLIPIKPTESFSEMVKEELGKTVFGQDEALVAISRRISMFCAGLAPIDRPLGTFFFLGASGVGKTEVGHAIARHYHEKDPDKHLKIINCGSEFQDRHDVAKLIGAPQGYVGWGNPHSFLITPNFLYQGRTVIVFDEIEKAHPQIQKTILGILDTAKLDIQIGVAQYIGVENKTLDFSDSIIILTSNCGSREAEQAQKKGSMGFVNNGKDKWKKAKGEMIKAYEKEFTPEFRGRINDVVVFNNLTPEIYPRIFDKFLDQKNKDMTESALRWGAKAPYLACSNEFKAWLLAQVNPALGGRSVRNLFDNILMSKVSDLLNSNFMDGKPVVADIENGEVVFYTDETIEEPPIVEIPITLCPNAPIEIPIRGEDE